MNTLSIFNAFEIGRIIVVEEQGGKERASYGKELLKNLSRKLTKEFGKDFILHMEKVRQFMTNFTFLF